MEEYLVVWSGSNGVVQSIVTCDPLQIPIMNNKSWVYEALISEDNTHEEALEIMDGDVNLHLVTPMPEEFIV